MASKKQKRYGHGGMNHKQVRSDRPNGKAYKQHPKAFDLTLRRLHTTARALAGKSHT